MWLVKTPKKRIQAAANFKYEEFARTCNYHGVNAGGFVGRGKSRDDWAQTDLFYHNGIFIGYALAGLNRRDELLHSEEYLVFPRMVRRGGDDDFHVIVSSDPSATWTFNENVLYPTSETAHLVSFNDVPEKIMPAVEKATIEAINRFKKLMIEYMAADEVEQDTEVKRKCSAGQSMIDAWNKNEA